MKELIVAGYPTTHSALLAGAVLSRQKNELMIANDDVAVLSREENDYTTIREPVSLSKQNQTDKDFWKRLSRLLFPPNQETVDLNSNAARLSSLGISETEQQRIDITIPPGTTGVLVLVDKGAADRVMGILDGFQGAAIQVHLKIENPREALQAMPKTG